MVCPPGWVTVAGTLLAPSGPDLTAPTAFRMVGRAAAGACAGAALKVASAWRRGALAASLAWIWAAARLSAIAPMTAGPRVKPKSRSMLVVPLAMPARWFGTVFTATAVTVEMARAKPIPTSASGAAITAMDKLASVESEAAHRSPAAMRMRPPPSPHLGS
jgi:hypothetical protein